MEACFPDLSETQHALLVYMGDAPLQRLEGGYWVVPGQEMRVVAGRAVPTQSFGTSTVAALVEKGVLIITRGGPPIGMTEVRRAGGHHASENRERRDV